jgi:hypothetical protein
MVLVFCCTLAVARIQSFNLGHVSPWTGLQGSIMVIRSVRSRFAICAVCIFVVIAIFQLGIFEESHTGKTLSQCRH